MEQTKSQRTAYGLSLVKNATKNHEIVALEADLGKSTMSHMMQEAFPSRYFQMGIAEANMAGVAAGLSLTGKVPFMSSFAVFCTARCYDQIRTSICIPNLNVKICGSSAGLSDYGDGATHQSIEDIAIMRALPNMNVFVPCDAVQTEQIIDYMATHHGPMYIRINRNDIPLLTEKKQSFIPGELYKLKRGSDLLIIACGAMVSKSLKASDELEKMGYSVSVVNAPTIKPINSDSLAALCKEYDDIIVAEEHSIIGGLASAISDSIGNLLSIKIHRVGIHDSFGQSSISYNDLMEYYGLTSQCIIMTALSILKNKPI